MASENQWLEHEFPFGMAHLQLRTVSFRECTIPVVPSRFILHGPLKTLDSRWQLRQCFRSGWTEHFPVGAVRFPKKQLEPPRSSRENGSPPGDKCWVFLGWVIYDMYVYTHTNTIYVCLYIIYIPNEFPKLKLINFGVLVWPILGEEHPRVDKVICLGVDRLMYRFWWVKQAKSWLKITDKIHIFQTELQIHM